MTICQTGGAEQYSCISIRHFSNHYISVQVYTFLYYTPSLFLFSIIFSTDFYSCRCVTTLCVCVFYIVVFAYSPPPLFFFLVFYKCTVYIVVSDPPVLGEEYVVILAYFTRSCTLPFLQHISCIISSISARYWLYIM